MKFPWSRSTIDAKKDDFIEQMRQASEPPPALPVLQRVVVQPVKYNGEAIRHKLVMQFDTGEIIIAQNDDADALSVIAAEMRTELGMEG